METAILWGLTPSAFFDSSERDRVFMVAHYRERNMRKAMIDKIQRDASDKKSKPAPAPSPTHDAFFGGLV